jgi:hypothetical protein
VSRGRRIISTEACVKDQAGKVLAHGTSALMVLGARDWRKAAGDEDSRVRTGICLCDGTREGVLANRGIWLAKSAPAQKCPKRLRLPTGKNTHEHMGRIVPEPDSCTAAQSANFRLRLVDRRDRPKAAASGSS